MHLRYKNAISKLVVGFILKKICKLVVFLIDRNNYSIEMLHKMGSIFFCRDVQAGKDKIDLDIYDNPKVPIYKLLCTSTVF